MKIVSYCFDICLFLSSALFPIFTGTIGLRITTEGHKDYCLFLPFLRKGRKSKEKFNTKKSLNAGLYSNKREYYICAPCAPINSSSPFLFSICPLPYYIIHFPRRSHKPFGELWWMLIQKRPLSKLE